MINLQDPQPRVYQLLIKYQWDVSRWRPSLLHYLLARSRHYCGNDGVVSRSKKGGHHTFRRPFSRDHTRDEPSVRTKDSDKWEAGKKYMACQKNGDSSRKREWPENVASGGNLVYNTSWKASGFYSGFSVAYSFFEGLYIVYRILTHADITLKRVERKSKRTVTGYTGLVIVGEPGSSSTSESDSTRENYRAHLRMHKNIFLAIIRRKYMFQRKRNNKNCKLQ